MTSIAWTISTTQNIATVPIAWDGTTPVQAARAMGPAPRRLRTEQPGDEQQLPEFHTDVEHLQRHRHGRLRGADLGQRPGEAEAMEQTQA